MSEWPPVNPPAPRPAQPTLSGPTLPGSNNPNTVYRYTLQTNANPNQEAIKTALMAACLAFVIIALVDLVAANYLFVRFLMAANDLSRQLGH